jgi:hypothetical protein
VSITLNTNRIQTTVAAGLVLGAACFLMASPEYSFYAVLGLGSVAAVSIAFQLGIQEGRRREKSENEKDYLFFVRAVQNSDSESNQSSDDCLALC